MDCRKWSHLLASSISTNGEMRVTRGASSSRGGTCRSSPSVVSSQLLGASRRNASIPRATLASNRTSMMRLSTTRGVAIGGWSGGNRRAWRVRGTPAPRETDTRRHSLSPFPEEEGLRLIVTPDELWEELKPLLSYMTPEEILKVEEATRLAYMAHDGQKRKSGEPYIIHPVAVAGILAGLCLDCDSVVAGLLHDTVEDTDRLTFQEIETRFGTDVRVIVEGETKVSKVTSKVRKAAASEEEGRQEGAKEANNSSTSASGQQSTNGGGAPQPSPAPVVLTREQVKQQQKAGDLQQMFLAMTREVRVIVVKLADRLHNMRTLDFMPAHKQKLIAQETLTVFAPLAHLLGMDLVMRELEDLSFPKLDPEGHAEVSRWLDTLSAQQEEQVLAAKAVVEAALDQDPFLNSMVHRVEVRPRAKTRYQVHKKRQELQVEDLTEIRDVSELLIILHIRDQKPWGSTSSSSSSSSSRLSSSSSTADTTTAATSWDTQGEDESRPPSSSPSPSYLGVSSTPGLVASPSQVCYHVLGVIHNIWPPVPGRMKDYIATPKPNGYRSLHTTVMPLNLPLRRPRAPRQQEQRDATPSTTQADEGSNEQQKQTGPPTSSPPPSPSTLTTQVFPLGMLIRTAGMHHVAECGAVALRAPAQDPADSGDLNQGDLNKEELSRYTAGVDWLSSLKEWQREFVGQLTPMEFVDTVTGDLLCKRVFTFTPAGEVLSLPKGATAVDFAYQIHTDIGDTMVGAKVNGVPVSASCKLRNADVVEILTYAGPPSARTVHNHKQWLKTAFTRSARHKITRLLQEWEDKEKLQRTTKDVSNSTAWLSSTSNKDTSKSSNVMRNDFSITISKTSSYNVDRSSRSNGNSSSASSTDASTSSSSSSASSTPPSPPSSSETTRELLHLSVWCYDRIGLLAEVSAVLTKNNFFIQTYSGTTDSVSGVGTMTFDLLGDRADLADVYSQLHRVQGLVRWQGSGGPSQHQQDDEPPTNEEDSRQE